MQPRLPQRPESLQPFEQQSLFCRQRSLSWMHIDWHVGTVDACAEGLVAQTALSQQFGKSREQGEFFGRQDWYPLAAAQRPVSILQDPEQQVFPPSPQESPEARQLADDAMQRLSTQVFEQQSLLTWQREPAVLQMPPPHTPSLHAKEQQSVACVQGLVSNAQNGAHTDDVPCPEGSHRPLQH